MSSTLSLAFIISIVSVFVLIIISMLIAIFAPKAYELSSQDKAIVIVLLTAYIWIISNIVGAYLGSRTPNTKNDQEINLPTSTSTIQEVINEIPVIDQETNIHDFNSLQGW